MWPVSETILSCRSYAELPDRRVVHTPFPRRRNISYGAVVYCRPTGRWLLVRTAWSYAFSSFMYGFFKKSDIPSILAFLTPEELETIRALYYGKKAWKDVYRGNYFEESQERFLHNREILRPYLSYKANSAMSTPWTFPKGRLEPQETPYKCALREFEEEAGLASSLLGNPVVPEQVWETYVSFDHQTYETRCWVFAVDTEYPLPSTEGGNEIVERRWCTDAEALELLSPTKQAMLLQAKSKLIV